MHWWFATYSLIAWIVIFGLLVLAFVGGKY